MVAGARAAGKEQSITQTSRFRYEVMTSPEMIQPEEPPTRVLRRRVTEKHRKIERKKDRQDDARNICLVCICVLDCLMLRVPWACHFLHHVPGYSAMSQISNMGLNPAVPTGRNTTPFSDGLASTMKSKLCNKYNTAE
ncbi:hypothetical protein RND71_032022 [Anisodus tanguticus]|uniref:Uncharacterized protein n=1 Tax=Anisodus tanguticus TaxID=243964 RepID=A0AAE1UZG0_9SOLA|nr:hypothetical protein RND71_032022 [Anisodus tanguticus]